MGVIIFDFSGSKMPRLIPCLRYWDWFGCFVVNLGAMAKHWMLIAILSLGGF